MATLPKWVREARNKWKYTGKTRPDFAEEPGPGQESVWDYPRPPRVEVDSREVVVRYGDTEIARSRQAVRILETAGAPVFYLPLDDIAMEYLVQSDRTSQCEWKGEGTYWHIEAGGERLEDVAWSYEDPYPEYEEIRGMVSFYPGRMECYVGDERVRPQPGGFYGGWVTSEIAGPIKGKKGTGSW